MRTVQTPIEPLEARRLLSADLTGVFFRKVPLVIPPQGNNHVTVRVTNQGDANAVGTGSILLYASTDATLDSSDLLLTTANAKFNLKPTKSSNVNIKFASPSLINTGAYFLLADVVGGSTITDQTPGNNVFATSATVSFTSPFVDLSGTVTLSPKTTSYTVGAKREKPLKLSVLVTDNGDVPAKGPFAISLFASSNQILDAQDPLLLALPAKPLNLKQGKSKVYNLTFTPTAATPSGTFYAIAEVNSGTTASTAIVENDIDNDTATSASTFTITNGSAPAGPKLAGALSDNIIEVVVGTPEAVTFSATISGATPTSTVEVDEVDVSGNLISKIANLHDSGSALDGDATAGDGIFSGIVPISFDAPGTQYFVAKLTDSTANTLLQTGALPVIGANAPSSQQLARDSSDLSVVGQVGAGIAANHGTAAQILAAVQTALASDSNVIPGSIEATSDAIAWESTDGIIQMISTDALLGDRGSSAVTQTVGAGTDAQPLAQIAVAAPADPALDNGQTALVLDPNNDQFAGANGIGDEAPGIAQDLTDAGYTVTYKGTNQVGLDDFRNLGNNAAVVIVSHGVNVSTYGTMLDTDVSTTEDAKVLHTSDLINHRLVMGVDNTGREVYCAEPSFFSQYTGSMDGSIVYLGACHLGDSSSMPDAFLGLGAGAVIAYTNTLPSAFGAAHGLAAFNTLLQTTDNTVGDIPGLNVDVALTASSTLSGSLTNVTPDGLVLTSAHSKFVSFGDKKATLPNGPLLINVNLVVTYSWPGSQEDLDTITSFDGQSAGAELTGGIYLNWLGDNQDFGGSETTVVDLYDAWAAGVFSTATSVSLGADWYTPDAGKGPATVSVALEDIHTQKQYEIQTATIAPGQEVQGAADLLEKVLVQLNGQLDSASQLPNPTIKIILNNLAP